MQKVRPASQRLGGPRAPEDPPGRHPFPRPQQGRLPPHNGGHIRACLWHLIPTLPLLHRTKPGGLLGRGMRTTKGRRYTLEARALAQIPPCQETQPSHPGPQFLPQYTGRREASGKPGATEPRAQGSMKGAHAPWTLKGKPGHWGSPTSEDTVAWRKTCAWGPLGPAGLGAPSPGTEAGPWVTKGFRLRSLQERVSCYLAPGTSSSCCLVTWNKCPDLGGWGMTQQIPVRVCLCPHKSLTRGSGTGCSGPETDAPPPSRVTCL